MPTVMYECIGCQVQFSKAEGHSCTGYQAQQQRERERAATPTRMTTCVKCEISYDPAGGPHVCPDTRVPNPLYPSNEDNWRHRAENMRCQTCMWFVPKTEKLGRCRANAPTIKGWPAMFPTDWCGEHKLDENKI